jgi:hypothetical protein
MAYKKYARECDECGKGMNEGYCFDGGRAYYCSDECLHKHFTPEEWEELCSDDDDALEPSDSYWTTWDEDPDEYMGDDEDPAPNRLRVELADAYELVDAGFYEGIAAMFREQLRKMNLDPNRYHLESWTIDCQVQIKEGDKA